MRVLPCLDEGRATRYPALEDGRIVTLEAKVRHKEAFAYESDELLALTSYVAHQSRGMPMTQKISEKMSRKVRPPITGAAPDEPRLRALPEQKLGQAPGRRDAEQGQPNGYPAYRLEWQKMGSLERRIGRACSACTRAAAIRVRRDARARAIPRLARQRAADRNARRAALSLRSS